MSSNIRIVQSALRACRKNAEQPDKLTKIILPILNKTDFLDNDADFRKVREVIYQLGLEDETVCQKVKVMCLTVAKPSGGVSGSGTATSSVPKSTLGADLGEYDEGLTQLLKLKTVKRIALDITYAKARHILADKNITSRAQYYDLCAEDARLTPEPDVVYGAEFLGWVDYLSIPRIYYDLETCKRKIAIYMRQNAMTECDGLDMAAVVRQLCSADDKFPPSEFWCDYYDVVNLLDIVKYVRVVSKPCSF